MRENFVTGSFMQFTLREMTVIARSPRLWTTFVVIVFIFTITGPFGTNTMPPAIRFFYWLTIQFAGWSNAILFAVLADALLDRWITSIFTRMMLGSLAAALPIGLWIGLIDYGFSAQPLTVQAFRTNAAISLPLSALFCVLAYMTLKQEIEIIPRAASQAPALLARLRPDIRGPLLRLCAEDHYTRIITSRGHELILLRFSDALKEIGDTPGLQIHRSHWIADAYVAELQRKNGALSLLTSDGTSLPVSRSSQKAALERYGSASSFHRKARRG